MYVQKTRKKRRGPLIVRARRQMGLKGTVSRDFLLLVFFINKFPPAPEYPIRTVSIFLQKFVEIFASQGAPQVSTTMAANFSTSFASVVDTGGKFATVSTIPAANNGNNVRLLRP